ncbi:MAG: hypothetical protein ACYDH3_03585 [Candidatus Aminicenantales bacterium]
MPNLFKSRKADRCVVVLGVITILAVGCRTNPYTARELVKVLKQAGGWTPLPIPDSKYQPGSIIKVTEDGVRWIDNLTSCGVPLAQFKEQSYIPKVTFSRQVDFAAKAVVNIKGITAGPEFNRISKVLLSITDQGADAIRILQLGTWMEDPANRGLVSPVCLEALADKDTYLVTEAFRISKGKYTFYDKTGMAIKIETPVLKDLLQFQPDVKYEITNDGSLVIEQPAYFAIRRAQKMGGGFTTLGSLAGEPEIADSKIEALFLKEAEKK